MEQGDELRRDHKVVDVRWEVGLDLGAATTNSAIVARRAPPDRPIELTLPETGTVVIEGVDATGDRVAIEGTGGVTLATDSQRDAEIRSRWQDHDYDFEIDEHAVRGRLEDGRLVIPRIPIGLGLLAFAQRNGASRFFGTSVTAPTKDGEVVTCRVVFGADGLLFRGRAVDEQRRPLPGSTLTSWIVAVNGPDEEASFDGPEAVYDGLGTITTDRDGRFVIDGGDGRCNWFRADRFMLTMSRNRPEAREGAVELPRSIGARVVELGDLTLSPAPLIASGTVVDERGDPVCGCRVDGPTWKSIDSCVHTMTDDHGRFELRGILFDKDLELSFRAALRPDKTLWPVDPGARDLVVRLPRSGGLKARFRMPMGAPKSTLSISLHHDEDGSDGAFDNCSTGVDSDEEFVDVGRWPGRWTMTVIGGGCEPLKLSGIVIHGGEITDLGEIAIDADTTLIRLAVRSAATGEPLDGAYLVRPRGTGKIDQLFADAPFGFDGPRHLAGGKIELYAKEQAVDIVVISLGHRAEVVTAHAGDQETQLRQALRVPLRIPEFAGQPPPPSELRLAVSLGGESSFPLRIAAPELEHVS